MFVSAIHSYLYKYELLQAQWNHKLLPKSGAVDVVAMHAWAFCNSNKNFLIKTNLEAIERRVERSKNVSNMCTMTKDNQFHSFIVSLIRHRNNSQWASHLMTVGRKTFLKERNFQQNQTGKETICLVWLGWRESGDRKDKQWETTDRPGRLEPELRYSHQEKGDRVHDCCLVNKQTLSVSGHPEEWKVGVLSVSWTERPKWWDA